MDERGETGLCIHYSEWMILDGGVLDLVLLCFC
jgi:hypothetical protein